MSDYDVDYMDSEYDDDDSDLLPDDEYDIEIDSEIKELDSDADEYFDTEVAEENSDEIFSLSEPVNSVSILEDKNTKESIIKISDKKIDINKLKKYKEIHFYNKLSQLEFITALCYLTNLFKLDMKSSLEIPELVNNYDYCNEETLALITILKNKTKLYTAKENKLYNFSNYPIKDCILLFKYFWVYLKEFKMIIKSQVIMDLFPNIIKNIDSKEVTEEEINDCLK